MSRPELKSSFSDLVRHPFVQTFSFFYLIFQHFINWILAPGPPPPSAIADDTPKKRVAVIGAGLTGVSSAAHCVGHGFDVQVFEARPKDKGLGGIWSRVNSTSSLQHHKSCPSIAVLAMMLYWSGGIGDDDVKADSRL
ncbi:hypothetical protein P175DRAFT_0534907 [Aspergillus ochraceoroseus IBT 24754]|uniref:FAD dependent oxidoreductase domain-containing protein n=1 Tax=Aspergillus ochraceoroseus IBT 24754 TaxID=1392256 RepID=A0A2T5LNZ8_9EURO|nr:uncharacterized protein P175DRAFT_0534907 [Aspergillus ochraceoroseus IBT 24754]PTU18010.1 hypothetical protein P175DRAFT_0534907 [Aspergillus ochraceoroseus IBT 24754]